MKSIVAAAFLVGGLLGSAIVYLVKSDSARDDVTASAEKLEISRLEAEIEKLRSERMQDQSSNTVSSLEQSNLPRKKAAISPYVPAGLDGEEAEKRLDKVKTHLKGMMTAKADVRLDTLTRRLGLSETQRKAFADLLDLQAEQLADVKATFMEGGASISLGKDKASFVREQDFENLAREILSDEQFESFEEMQREEQQAKWDTIATSRLNNIAPALGMSADEKDEVYGVFYEEAQEMGDQVTADERAERLAEREDRLKEILGEERFESYKELGPARGIFTKRIEVKE